jgi:hypothetical protein
VSAPQRALVQRPQRRLHLATLQGDAWLTVCDRELPLDGTAARPHLWHDELTEEQIAGTCRRCLGPILTARLALVEGHRELVAEVGTLRRRLTSALDVARRYSDRILATSAGTTEHAIAARRHEERVDRKLARLGR